LKGVKDAHESNSYTGRFLDRFPGAAGPLHEPPAQAQDELLRDSNGFTGVRARQFAGAGIRRLALEPALRNKGRPQIRWKEGEQNDEPNSDTGDSLDRGGVVPDASDHSPQQTQSFTQLTANHTMIAGWRGPHMKFVQANDCGPRRNISCHHSSK
jgi:hypothetical protein